jgi:hypothetical protein
MKRARNVACVFALLAAPLAAGAARAHSDKSDDLRTQVEKIVAGKSDVKEAAAGGVTVKVGDAARLREADQATVMNLTPVKTEDGPVAFGEDCSVDEGGGVRVLGFTDDGKRALVEYTPPKEGKDWIKPSDLLLCPHAPEGVQYFLAVEEFARLAGRGVAQRKDRAALKAQVEKIVAGKSEVNRVTVGGRTVEAGDTAPLSRDYVRVDVMNLTPVKDSSTTYLFRDRGDFDSCVVSDGGVVRVLGFTDDGAQALVEYAPPDWAVKSGAGAPAGVQYFLAVERVVTLADEDAAKRKARADLKAQIEKITAGKSKLKEVQAAGRTVRTGDTAPIRQHEWVLIMNLAPVQGDSFAFQEHGPFLPEWAADGEVRVLGFTDDGKLALVEYTRGGKYPFGIKPSEMDERMPPDLDDFLSNFLRAPSGAQFFIGVERLAKMKP